MAAALVPLVACWSHSFVGSASVPLVESQSEQKFIVFGDWGGRSEHEPTDPDQKAGAAGMAKVANQSGGIDFIVSVGDHFYEGGIKGSAHDKRFKVTFEDIYHQKELQCPWYLVAGNHDHSGNIQSQIDYTKLSRRWNYPALWHTFTKSFVLDGKTITSQFIALDAIVMLGMHDEDKAVLGEHYWDMEPHPMQVHGDAQLAWFDKVMKESTADYLWVYAHYPMYSASGPHTALVNKIGAQMTKYGASGYFAGHEHTMYEFTNKDDTMKYVVTGGGSRGMSRKVPPSKPYADGVKWEWGHTKASKQFLSGFTSVTVDGSASTMRFHNEKGEVVHTSVVPPRK